MLHSVLAAPSVTWGRGICVAPRQCGMRIPRPTAFPQDPGAGGHSDSPDVGTPCLSESNLNVAPHAAQKQDSQSGCCHPALESYCWAVALRAGPQGHCLLGAEEHTFSGPPAQQSKRGGTQQLFWIPPLWSAFLWRTTVADNTCQPGGDLVTGAVGFSS